MTDEPLPGIPPPHVAFYIEAMLFCTKSAATSLVSINECLAHLTPDDPHAIGEDIDTVLDNFYNIAVQGASLSRYLWPSRRREPHLSRGDHLRQRLGVMDDSPLQNRDLRNQMEHFDERLDLYLEDGIVGVIFPKYVGPSLEEEGVPTHLFRAYYVDTSVFVVLGRRYEMQPIVAEIARIHDRLVAHSTPG